MFGDDGELVREIDGMSPRVRKKYIQTEQEKRRMAKVDVYCPFCLYRGVEANFANVNMKTGEMYKTYTCPECMQNMKPKTLEVVARGAREYSEWFWSQVYSFKGHGRMSWDKVKDRVKVMGIAEVFWEVWKEMKAEKGRGHSAL